MTSSPQQVDLDKPPMTVLESPVVAGSAAVSSRKKIWIDMENSPHVPFFRPIIRELEQRGYALIVTARDYAQTLELANLAKLDYIPVGRHYGKHTVAKMLGLGIRTLQMAPAILREKPDLAVSHGSRSQFALASLLGIVNITIIDYEHTRWVRFPKNSWLMAPEVIPDEVLEASGVLRGQILRYPGIKEDVYTPSFHPNVSFKAKLGLNEKDTVVTIRPPATEAHYHNPESEKLLEAVLRILSQRPNTKTVLVPRTAKQGEEMYRDWPQQFASGSFLIPHDVVDGLDLIWYSDLVISGGGTMNREAAALGVPVYSIFRGKLGAVDKYLSDTGRLILLQSPDDVANRLKLGKRNRSLGSSIGRNEALEKVVENIAHVMES